MNHTAHDDKMLILALRDQVDALIDALRALTDVCDHVPVFQLDNGKASVKAVRLAGKFTTAHRNARALLAKGTK